MEDFPIMQFFEYKHLPEKLQFISKPFAIMANDICHSLPFNEETQMCLRKLLEAKDCAVRAFIYKQGSTV